MNAKKVNAFTQFNKPNLQITFKKTKEVLYLVDKYFKFNYYEEWFDDPLVKEMVLDVDDTLVKNASDINSPVLGNISVNELSGGVKALILMLKEDRIIWATACGDNCAKWILEIAKRKKITICLEHNMEFEKDFDAYCIDNDKFIHSLDDYWGCVLECLYCI